MEVGGQSSTRGLSQIWLHVTKDDRKFRIHVIVWQHAGNLNTKVKKKFKHLSTFVVTLLNHV
jgi:hypothetical protein